MVGDALHPAEWRGLVNPFFKSRVRGLHTRLRCWHHQSRLKHLLRTDDVGPEQTLLLRYVLGLIAGELKTGSNQRLSFVRTHALLLLLLLRIGWAEYGVSGSAPAVFAESQAARPTTTSLLLSAQMGNHAASWHYLRAVYAGPTRWDGNQSNGGGIDRCTSIDYTTINSK